MADIAKAVKSVTDALPADVNWVLRVDAMTVGTNDESWFLGQARALSVAQNLMAAASLPSGRVAASGIALGSGNGDGRVEILIDSR